MHRNGLEPVVVARDAGAPSWANAVPELRQRLISLGDDIVRFAKLRNTAAKRRLCLRGRGMRKQDGEYDYHRYRQLLAEAGDERKRLALIALLIEEKAKDRLAAERASDRAAMTARTVAKVLENSSIPRDRPAAAVHLNLVSLQLVKDAR
jgi:hypothetical protein